MRNLAIVVQRYGTEITGGAEYHARWVAGRLRDRFDITVYTTTALDYLTWANHYREGRDEVDGVPVLRFAVERQRDMAPFIRYSDWIFSAQHRPRDERKWLLMQGPQAPGLLKALRSARRRHDLFFFFTYLYYTTVLGLEEVADRAVLQPTAHDEPPLRLGLYKRVFSLPAGFLLNTTAEGRMLDERFGLGHRPRAVVGMGIDWPEEEVNPEPTLRRLGVRTPYALAFGRIADSKGHDLVLRQFSAGLTNIDLVLFGAAELDIPDHPRIRYLGRVSNEEKWALIAGARFTIHPSPYESLSLALLESWAMGVPALVNGACAVLLDHVEACGGGRAYHGEAHFGALARELAGAEPDSIEAMGRAGRKYVHSRYRSSQVAERYAEFFERMIDTGCRVSAQKGIPIHGFQETIS